MSHVWDGPLEKMDDCRWRIPKSYKAGMRVDGIVYADEKLLKDIRHDKALEQVANVAFLPGIVKASFGMPDIHWGYGFPIGGVAAMDIEKGGVVSPGGVGYDINCGVRLVRTDLLEKDVRPRLKELVTGLFQAVPSGVGSEGDIRVTAREEKEILAKGAAWAVGQGFGTRDDLDATEEHGCMPDADPDKVSERAYARGRKQSGTLGSGNHFLEVQAIDQLYDREAADVLGLEEGQVMVMIHSGSRGLGYQVCDDSLRTMEACLAKYHINVPDRQLACAPVESSEGRDYLAAMRAAANYAWNNRQCMMHLTRQVFEKIFGSSWQKLGMRLVYDVAHNIAKIETHRVKGEERTLCVHRKGATRAFGPGHPGVPEKYKTIGQPVIIPGDMGRNSYLLVGTQAAMDETFGSTCHGAGRLKSRHEAKRQVEFHALMKELEAKGIVVMASGRGTVVEEAPGAYKDVNDVVGVVHQAGIAKRVCRMRPLGVVKG
ncbi:MAG: RtcB family protein [Candidatus Omnitrophica bacterium]|nr:RtcB family protein [Candidatus Omnitrophota bacterium]MDD5574908.1 RtcB family protein [Candidatus Omnitrophota bacterium]